MTIKATWTIRGGRTLVFPPLLIMGIVNVTPDSFSDGGAHYGQGKGVDDVLRYCRDLTDQGVDILDIGGESTRPGSEFVKEEEELRRVLPVVRALRHEDTGEGDTVPLLSVDTWRAETARACLEAGVEIINDISGGVFDPVIGEVAAAYKAGFVLGHCPENPKTMQQAPYYENVVEAVYTFFAERLTMLEKQGLPVENVILDPCIGFGKNLQHNLEILRGLNRFRELGRPLLIGLSRKRMFNDLLGIADPIERDPATQTFTTLLAQAGVEVQRVHNVRGGKHALKIAEAMSCCGDGQ